MNSKINMVTVYEHGLFGSLRTIKSDDEVLFVLQDVLRCLKLKNIFTILNKCNITPIKVDIECVTAVNNNNLVLDKREINVVSIIDLFKLINSSYKTNVRLFKLWVLRDICNYASGFREELQFNRELYKDEYIELQQNEFEILKSKIFLLEKHILNDNYISDKYCLDEKYYSKLHNENKSIQIVNTYQNELYGEIRTIIKNNKTLFVANDIAKCLKIKNPNVSVKTYCYNIVKIPIYQDEDRRVVNMIYFDDVIELSNKSTKVDKRMFELWIKSEILNEENGFEKDVVYYGEYYKDLYINDLSNQIERYRDQIKILEQELNNSSNTKIVQDNKNLITNYDLYKNITE